MKHARLFKSFGIMLALILYATFTFAQYAPSAGAGESRAVGKFVANQYNFSGNQDYVATGNSATGTQTITLQVAKIILADGRIIFPFSVTSPIIVGVGSNAELVTPTSVSNCVTVSAGNQFGQCSVTASFSNTHAFGEPVTSGTGGLSEAIYDAYLAGGGVVNVDNQWQNGVNVSCTGCYASPNAALASIVPYPSVSIEDTRAAATQMWWTMPTVTTALAAPAVLTGQAACDSTHQFCSDANVAGSASWGGAVYGCYTLVDINGNESPCSATNNFTSVASKAIDMGVSFTARTDNVVGWKPYLSVSGGSYALAYSIPLLTQPTSLLAVPLSAGVCTLTALETTTPACAIANSTYGQAGSTTGVSSLFKGGAQITGYPVVTSTLAPEIGSASATAYNPNEDAHATYAYAPGNRLGVPGVQGAHVSFPITAAAQTTVGEVEASIPIPANFMNYVGKTLEVCGLIAKTSTVADTVDKIQLWWDAEGSNVTAGTPVQLTSINMTAATALAAAADIHFCQQIITTVASTSATGGTIQPGVGYATISEVSAGVHPVAGSSSLVAGVGSLNLALPAHISVMLVHTTGTDGAGSILYGLTARVVN